MPERWFTNVLTPYLPCSRTGVSTGNREISKHDSNTQREYSLMEKRKEIDYF